MIAELLALCACDSLFPRNGRSEFHSDELEAADRIDLGPSKPERQGLMRWSKERGFWIQDYPDSINDD